MNVALYARVSTEEQAKHGISIDAQTEALRRWAKEQNHTVVGEYIDNGVSARKSPSKRPALQTLLSDIPAKQTELIAFTKLDRWTRNVKGYYQVQEILDRNKVAWIAIQEDYETITASGRFKVNIMLSVAENEADRTSERIKTVFEHKVELGEAVTGALPLGLKIENKHVVKDENAPIVLSAFEYYAAHGNKTGVRNMLQERYNINLPVLSVDKMLHNPLYKGVYRTNAAYCEPIVPPELFDQVQHDLANRATRRTPSGFTYLFTGLIVCADCGRKMCSGTHRLVSGDRSAYYRCPSHYMMHFCNNRNQPGEAKIEQIILTKCEELTVSAKGEYTPPPKEKRRRPARSEILKKLDRLKDLYVDGLITKEQYKRDYDRFNAMLAEPVHETPQKAVFLLGKDFRKKYEEMTREKKKTLWRSIIDHMEINGAGELFVYFK